MWQLVNFAILVCYFSNSDAAPACYPDYCLASNTTKLVETAGFQCLLTTSQRGEDCDNLTFDGYDRYPAEDETSKFNLRAYVYESNDSRVTAFNFSVTDANFRSLVMRYQSLTNVSGSVCRHIKLYGNKTNPAPRELYVSCPVYYESYEAKPYQLEYLVIGERRNYSKRYIFNVPSHDRIIEGISVKNYKPFVYVDTSYAPLFVLHVQALPEIYNVSRYKTWLINENTEFIETFNVSSKQDFRFNFTGRLSEFHLKVAAMHPECGDYGCNNATTPSISIPETFHLLIMIVCLVWVPLAVLFCFYCFYKAYRKETLKRMKKTKCLLVYSSVRLTHTHVMIELAKYLRNCNIDAMIDILDAKDTASKNLERWCDSAFQSTEVVLVATSPPPKHPVASAIYQNTYSYLLNLVKQSEPDKGKRYYIVQLPYCKLDDVPEGISHLKRLCLPKELPKLVQVIYNKENVKCISSVPDNVFLKRLEFAKLEILEEDLGTTKEEQETDNLLTSENTSVPKNQVFDITIDKIDLLGESEENEQLCTRKSLKSLDNDTCDFHIDNLEM